MDWNDYFVYDESSPSCLRWRVSRKGSGKGKPKLPNDVAGEVYEGVPYYQVAVAGKKCYVHRIVWEMHNGPAGDSEIDHENLNKTDNRAGNLRRITHARNMRNCKMQHNNSSGVTGVDFDPVKNRWRAKWKALDGAHKGRSFSVIKYGEAAFDLAVKARADAISKLNQSGADYTVSHGATKGELHEMQTTPDA
jgi:hypothetical protein